MAAYSHNVKKQTASVSAPLQLKPGKSALRLEDNRQHSILQKKQIAIASGKQSTGINATVVQKKNAVPQTTSTFQSGNPVQRFATGKTVQLESYWDMAQRYLGGAVGGIVGGVAGTVTGAVSGYRDGGGVLTGAMYGMLDGAVEGFQQPGTKVGEVAGGMAGSVVGAGGALLEKAGINSIANLSKRAEGIHKDAEGLKAGLYNGFAGGLAEGYQHPLSTAAAIGGAAIAPVVGTGLALKAAGSLAGIGGAEAIDKKIKKGKSLKTKIVHTTSHVNVTGVKNKGEVTKHEVGKKMVARLSPTDPVLGSATDVNWTWMQALRRDHPNANIIRGHLLNHDLGGFGIPENLYPISTKANHIHSVDVEQHVKQLLYNQLLSPEPKMVNYSVQVSEDKQFDPANAKFNCRFYVEGKSPKTVPVESHLGTDHGGFGGKTDNPLKDRKEWNHGKRKGDKDGTLGLQKAAGRINIKKTTERGLTDKQDAAYNKGAGAVQVNLESIFATLDGKFFNHWDADVKYAVCNNNKGRDDFGTIIRKIVQTSASYKDNEGDQEGLMELISQVVIEQLNLVKGKVYSDEILKETITEAKKMEDYPLFKEGGRSMRSDGKSSY
jgi:hypothetical protein